MLAAEIPVPWLCRKGKGKAKGPIYIESEDEGSEAMSKATQGKAKVTGHVQSPLPGVPPAVWVEDGVFAVVSVPSRLWNHLRLMGMHGLGSRMKCRGAHESPEPLPSKHAHCVTAPSDELEDLALVSGLIEDIKGAVVDASLTWRKVEDNIWAVEDWERGLRRRLRETSIGIMSCFF